ncbi:epimerase [Halocynthiibacter sp. C4]|uniref:epimerase n=1 Tax=Halocynthiibacter sp. C4 TaxID=2992758 RepID=UPI00237C4C51|nr:epimerase [Halocynthiibacter sp. C4]MDE0590853.1 epimerase [Halocynthiibacter sp. C4]
MSKTVLITGATGKIGRHANAAFTKAGWQVRTFNRASDDLCESATGADVIVNGFNPPAYRNWATEVPRYTAQIIEAAKQSGAMVIVPGNVYNYGNTPGTWGPNTPQRAETRKGNIRIEMEQQYRSAARDGVQTLILRAGDFIDSAPSDTLMSLVFLSKLSKDKLMTMGPVDCPRSFSYLPDWARAAVMLAERRDTLQQFEDVPAPSVTITMQDLRSALEMATGRHISIKKFPWWTFHVASPFWTLAYELLEMRYLSETPHSLCGKRLAELLPEFTPTAETDVLCAEVPTSLMAKEFAA